MRKVPRQQRSQETVERIITAARVTLTRDGYSRFTTNRVAAEAGVSPGSLYQYFPDKAALIDVIVDRYWAETVERVNAVAMRQAVHGRWNSVETGIGELLDTLEEHAELMRVIAEELPVVRSRERRAALHGRIRDVTATYLMATQHLSPATAYQRAWVVITTVEAVTANWILTRPNIAREELVNELARLTRPYLFGS